MQLWKSRTSQSSNQNNRKEKEQANIKWTHAIKQEKNKIIKISKKKSKKKNLKKSKCEVVCVLDVEDIK